MKHLILPVLVLVPALAFAKTLPGGPAPAIVRVSAEATVSRAPDRVYIDVGVRTVAPSPNVAATDNATRLARVIAAVRKASGPGAQLTTTGYTLAPQYQYHSDGKPPTPTGYAVTNQVQVRLDDLGRIAAVIDAANGAGANLQQDLRFALRDPQAVRLRALARAAHRAREEAGALAAALGLRVVRIVSVEAGGTGRVWAGPGGPRLYQRAIPGAPPGSPTPIESGAIPVNASVNMTVAVAPR